MPGERSDSVRKRPRVVHPATVALALLAGAFGCQPGRPAYTVRLTGAQIATEYVDRWLQAAERRTFRTEKPINPTWSRVGFVALARDECDLACVDRPIEASERRRFGGEVAGRAVGFYGYALYVHPANPIDSVFAGHIGPIFAGEVGDWHELIAADVEFSGPIRLYGPPKADRGGALLLRQAGIWFDDPPWTMLDSDAEIMGRVAEDPYALGFAQIGYDEGVRYVGLRMARNGEAAFPSVEEIRRGEYGLARLIYVYYRTPASEAVGAALEYLGSPAGAAAMREIDVWPLPAEPGADSP